MALTVYGSARHGYTLSLRMGQYRAPPSSLSLFSLAMVEREINDPIRTLICRETARAPISRDRITAADCSSAIFGRITSESMSASFLECDGLAYTTLVIDPLLPAVCIWVEVEIIEVGLAPLPDDLSRWLEDLQNRSTPVKKDKECRTTITRRVCLNDLVDSIMNHCASNENFDRRSLFHQLFEDPVTDMSQGLPGVLSRSVVQVDWIVDDFFRMDTYSKALLFLETFIAHLEQRSDVSIRLHVLDILVPEFCFINRRTIIRNNQHANSRRINEGLEADRDVTVVSLERILSKFLYPATLWSFNLHQNQHHHHQQQQHQQEQELQRRPQERDRDRDSSTIDKIFHCIIHNKSLQSQTDTDEGSSVKKAVGAAAPGDLVVAINNVPVRNRWRLLDCKIGNHYILYPVFPSVMSRDSQSDPPLTFLSLKRETISRFLLPGLFGHAGQFRYGPCYSKSNNHRQGDSATSNKDWFYALADYSPLRSLQRISASRCCGPTSLKPLAVLPYYF
nr:MAG: wsv415-like protein [Marsupenaeus japonicus pemonivirus]